MGFDSLSFSFYVDTGVQDAESIRNLLEDQARDKPLQHVLRLSLNLSFLLMDYAVCHHHFFVHLFRLYQVHSAQEALSEKICKVVFLTLRCFVGCKYATFKSAVQQLCRTGRIYTRIMILESLPCRFAQLWDAQLFYVFTQSAIFKAS